MFKQKLIASFFHLILSLLLVGVVIGVALFLFFPKIFIAITDFKEIAFIIISVDLILGPLLTFVVFQKNKKSLKFDLSVIAVIQLSALFYGTYALFQAHPVYITFNVDRFTIVTAKDAEPHKAIFEEYKISKFETAKMAFAKIPEDQDKRSELSLSAGLGGEDLDKREEYYEPYNKNINNIITKSIDKDLILAKSDLDNQIKAFFKKNNANINSFSFLPITSNKKDAILVLDKITAQPITIINTDPWSF